jgi:hypothetical protein
MRPGARNDVETAELGFRFARTALTASKAVPLTDDPIETVIDLLFRQVVTAIGQRVGEPGNHGNGSLQLVGHDREELALPHHLASPCRI